MTAPHLKPFIGIINRANALSLLGLAFSLFTVFFAFHGRFTFAIVCFLWAGVCDIYDGELARRLKLSAFERSFGSQLDTIIDMASFGIVPCVLFLQRGMTTTLDYLIFIFYACAAAMRLAYFNTLLLSSDGKVRSYVGLPVTYVSWIFPTAWLVTLIASEAISFAIFRVILLVIAFLFIANFKIPKLTDWIRTVLTAYSLLATAFWLALMFRQGR